MKFYNKKRNNETNLSDLLSNESNSQKTVKKFVQTENKCINLQQEFNYKYNSVSLNKIDQNENLLKIKELQQFRRTFINQGKLSTIQERLSQEQKENSQSNNELQKLKLKTIRKFSFNLSQNSEVNFLYERKIRSKTFQPWVLNSKNIQEKRNTNLFRVINKNPFDIMVYRLQKYKNQRISNLETKRLENIKIALEIERIKNTNWKYKIESQLSDLMDLLNQQISQEDFQLNLIEKIQLKINNLKLNENYIKSLNKLKEKQIKAILYIQKLHREKYKKKYLKIN